MNNKELKVEGTSIFYKYFFENNIKYTTDLLYDMSNIAPLNVNRDAGLKSFNFLAWTCLRQSVPLKQHCNMPNLKVIFDLEIFKCCNYYFYFIKHQYEKPSKWKKLKEEFNLKYKQGLEAFVMTPRVTNEPYLRSFQYKVLNSILYTNELLCK